MSSFFNETCKILGIHRSRTSIYHAMSNGQVERLHRNLHTTFSHYVNKSHTDWAYRASPHYTTGYSPFFLFHGREMVTPASEKLRPKFPKPTRGPEQLIESLKASLRQAYSAVARANSKSYVANKERYDKCAKSRSFEVGSYVYLFNPARKPGLSKNSFLLGQALTGSRQNCQS